MSVTEIADRLNVPLNRVTMWKKRGNLPDPHWVIGGNGVAVWDWPELEATCDIVKSHIGTVDYSSLVDAIPRNRALVAVETENLRAYAIQSRINRRRSPDAANRALGFLSIPLAGKQQLVITDDVSQDGLPITYTDAVKRARAEIRRLKQVRRTGDFRAPSLSPAWSDPTAG